MHDLSKARWFKSTRSNANASCVEVATNLADHGTVGLRDSKDPHGAVLAFSPQTWNTFVQDAVTGRFHGRTVL